MTRIKICGLFRHVDVSYVNMTLPDYVGFVFAKSPRQVSEQRATSMRKVLDERITPVGVFVDAPIEMMARLYNQGVIQVAQLHGKEVAKRCRLLRQESDVPIIAAVTLARPDSSQLADSPSELCYPPEADYLLLDNVRPGSGQRFDWELIKQANLDRPYFLAGGIKRFNIDAALRLKPFAIDVSSGAEKDGHKDLRKIEYLVRKVREGEKP
ncbi:MAG: phosphoribosylanthranilate isomerase [Coriobacteriales bacterium]|jgi:phosphoribosylanthranilate isomerase|nr:phosphoribosylanthranilate isomerase [Coriobacteriales bacterium]